MKRTLDQPHINVYGDEETLTLSEVIEQLQALLIKLGPDHQVRVNTSYDQGQCGMAITDIKDCGGYVGIDA